MEITSLGAPSTPVRASSAEASPPCRNPMDDSDLSQTRKRPRLDSGDRSYRSMSADELANTPSRNTLRHSPSTPARYQTATAKENETSVLPSVCGTPSKVTINVKDPLPDDSPPQTTASISGMDTKGGQGVFSQAPNVEGSTEAQASSPDVISVSSSASRSPEIEVAEVEDMNEMPGETRWRSLGEATEIQRRHLQDFPYVTRSRNPYHTIDAIITAIDKGDLGYLRSLHTLTSQQMSSLRTTGPSRSSPIGSRIILRPQKRNHHDGGTYIPIRKSFGTISPTFFWPCQSEGKVFNGSVCNQY